MGVMGSDAVWVLGGVRAGLGGVVLCGVRAEWKVGGSDAVWGLGRSGGVKGSGAVRGLGRSGDVWVRVEMVCFRVMMCGG